MNVSRRIYITYAQSYVHRLKRLTWESKQTIFSPVVNIEKKKNEYEQNQEKDENYLQKVVCVDSFANTTNINHVVMNFESIEKKDMNKNEEEMNKEKTLGFKKKSVTVLNESKSTSLKMELKEKTEEEKQGLLEMQKIIRNIQELSVEKKKNIISYVNTLQPEYLEEIDSTIRTFFEHLDEYFTIHGILLCDIGGEEIVRIIEEVSTKEEESFSSFASASVSVSSSPFLKKKNEPIDNIFNLDYIKKRKKELYGDHVYPIVQHKEEDVEANRVKHQSEIINIKRQILIERSSYKKAVEDSQEFIANLHNLKKITEVNSVCSAFLLWTHELEKRIQQYKEEKKKQKKRNLLPDSIDDKLLAIICVKWAIQYTFNPIRKKYSNNITTQSKHFEQTYPYQSLFTHIAIKIGEEVNNEVNFQQLEKNNLLPYLSHQSKGTNCSFAVYQKLRLSQIEKNIKGVEKTKNIKEIKINQWNSAKKAAIGGLLLKMLIDHAVVEVDIATAKEEYKNEYKYYLFLHKTAKKKNEKDHETKAETENNSVCKYTKELQYERYYEEESNSLEFIIKEAGGNMTLPVPADIPKEAKGKAERSKNFSQKQKDKLKDKQIILYRSKRDKSKVQLPVFMHSYIWKNNNWYGVIHMRVCCANYLLNRAIESHVPLNCLPMICKPQRWTETEGGMLLFHNKFIRCNIVPLFNVNTCNLNRVREVVSEIGNVKWKIHKEILHYIEYAYSNEIEIGNIPRSRNYDIPEKYTMEELKKKDAEEIKKYYLLRDETHRLNRSLLSERPTFLQKLAVAKTLQDCEVIYFPHNIDFRGRMYPLSPHLHHMSDDICRSLIVFYEKKEIGPNGLFWLKIHLANNFGKDKLNFEQRIKWVDSNLESIRKLSKNPFDNLEFWKSSEKPWQSLAVAIDLINALESKNPSKYKSNIPIQQDGTCNGLQHYASLGKDYDGGKAVNIIPCIEPQDLYTVVLNIVTEKIKKEIPTNKLATYCFEFNLLKRKVVKQTIMTICYGVTSRGARSQVKGKIVDMIGRELDESTINSLSQYIANYIFESISEIFKRAMIIKKWFNKLSSVTNELNIPVTWISPIGLPCEQPYRIAKRVLVKTPLQSISVNSYTQTTLDKHKQRLGFPPNFVHSLDASHLMMTAEKMLIENKHSFAAVHDSYWTHACNVDEMNRHIRETFVTLYNEPILQNLYMNFKNRLGKNYAHKISEPPEQGKLDVSLVRNSLYFFS